MRIVSKYEPRKFTAVCHDGGFTLCDSQDGAFITLHFPEDITKLKELLDSLKILEAA